MENSENKSKEENRLSRRMEEEIRNVKPGEQVNDDSHKKHGDKQKEGSADQGRKVKGDGATNEPDDIEEADYQVSQDDRYESNAEFADPNETDKDYLKQPQPMSKDLESIYPGKQTTRKERQSLEQERKKAREEENEQAEEERKNIGQAGYSSNAEKSASHLEQKRYVDAERGNYSKHNDYQDRQGYERDKDLEDEYPQSERTRYSYSHSKEDDATDENNERNSGSGSKRSGFPSSRQNQWDENATNPKGYGETDFDDIDVRRRQDEGQQPWSDSGDEFEDSDDSYVSGDRPDEMRRRNEDD